jgi:membrane associated rhomboid family serine protease
VFPVSDATARRTTPYVNWTLLAINIGVFLYMLVGLEGESARTAGRFASERDSFLLDWAFMPACVAEYFGVSTDARPSELAVCPTGDRVPLQIFTSMFLHAGWAHIIGNMLFLWIFGDNVEDRVGHLKYLVFYLLCGVAAAFAQTAFSLDTVIPSVGASGAISGVMGAYLVLYPTAPVQVVVLPFFFLPFGVPALFMIGFWFLMQLISGYQELAQVNEASSVAWWAHIGGFIAGALLIWFFKRPQPRRWRPRESPLDL